MIVRSDPKLWWMSSIHSIIVLLLIVCVVLPVDEQLQIRHGWCVLAWRTTSPIPIIKQGGVMPKRIWGSPLRRSASQQSLHVPEIWSMKLPQELNSQHDTTIPIEGMYLTNFQVRDCTHGELNIVADIIIDSFYNYTDSGSIWKQLTKLAELNRIQQNFPYGPDKAHHRMMVVTGSTTNHKNTSDITTTICGFVDIDTRIPNRPTSYKYNPRPYLSDLCIHPNYRRYGLASLLIQSCEDYCRNHHHSSRINISRGSTGSSHRNDFLPSEDNLGPEIFIRVETKNTMAIQMYEKLGYSILSDHADSSNENILILYKEL